MEKYNIPFLIDELAKLGINVTDVTDVTDKTVNKEPTVLALNIKVYSKLPFKLINIIEAKYKVNQGYDAVNKRTWKYITISTNKGDK